MNKKVYTVNSHHQNKILSLPQNFEIVAITKEGDIEAFKHKQRNIWGVVWHPERMDKPVLPNDLEKILN